VTLLRREHPGTTRSCPLSILKSRTRPLRSMTSCRPEPTVAFATSLVRNGTVTCRTPGNFAERRLSDFRYFRIRPTPAIQCVPSTTSAINHQSFSRPLPRHFSRSRPRPGIRMSCSSALRWHSTQFLKSRTPSSMCSRRIFSGECSWQP